MRVFWLNGALCFRAQNEQESEWSSQFYDMLEGGKFVFEVDALRTSNVNDDESVPPSNATQIIDRIKQFIVRQT